MQNWLTTSENIVVTVVFQSSVVSKIFLQNPNKHRPNRKTRVCGKDRISLLKGEESTCKPCHLGRAYSHPNTLTLGPLKVPFLNSAEFCLCVRVMVGSIGLPYEKGGLLRVPVVITEKQKEITI
jgi:hypothetical protein